MPNGTEKNFQELLLADALFALDPLVQAASDPQRLVALGERIGWDMRALGGEAFDAIAAGIAAVLESIAAIEEWIDDPPQTLEDLLRALDTTASVAEGVAGAFEELPGSLPPEAGEIPLRLLEDVLLTYLIRRRLTAFHVLRLLGVIRTSGAGEVIHQGAIVRDDAARERLELARVGDLVTRPTEELRALYLAGGLPDRSAAASAGALLFEPLSDVLSQLDFEALAGTGGLGPDDLSEERRQILESSLTVLRRLTFGAADSELGLTLTIVPATDGGPGLFVSPFGSLAIDESFDGWDLRFKASADVGGALLSARGVEFPSDASSPRLAIGVALERGSTSDAALSIGSTTGTRLVLGKFQVHAAGSFTDDDQYYDFSLKAAAGQLVVAPGDGDGFLQQVLPQDGLRTDFELQIGWSKTLGLHVGGAAGLDAVLPVHVSLGPLTVETVHVSFSAEQADGAPIRAGVSASPAIRLGPVRAAVNRLGLELRTAFPERGGNLGPVHLELGFKPPDGAGLSIEAGAVTGGGFLAYNEQNAEYVGALRLQFEGIQLGAIGILTTRLPGGEAGFSLLIIVSAAGFAPIQLGFGFTLTGVGGLLGINRSVDVDVLRAGIRNRTLDAILFSKEDPVTRAPAIVGALRNVFPPTLDSHAFGPMARIEWGSPTKIVTLELALILQLPAPLRLIILGRLRVSHPEEDPKHPEQKPIVAINLDALGVVDFDRQEAALDAALYDSKLMGFVLTGQMAMRASWGTNPGFALALGGFHPRYAAPVGFPSLERVALTLASLDSPRLRLESYLALTSNTVQFGSRVDFYVKVAEFSLDGKLGFDALICLDPFEFEADIAGSLTLKHGQSVLMAVAIAMTLSGPTPWHARGRATFEILGFKQAVAFDHKFGEELPPPSSDPIEVLGELRAALEKPEAWSAQLPAEGQLVTLAGPAPDGRILVHPLGALTLSQRIVPLEVRISKFGTRAAAGPTTFTISSVRAGKTDLELDKVSDYFAPAQFLEMSDDQKLAAPSYEPMVAGVRARPGEATCGEMKEAPICYETTVIGPDGTEIAPDGDPPCDPLPAGILTPLAATGPAALAATRVTGRAKYQGDDLEVAVVDPEHVVASDDLRTLADVEATGGTYLGADEALRAYLDTHPDEQGRVRIVAKREVLA